MLKDLDPEIVREIDTVPEIDKVPVTEVEKVFVSEPGSEPDGEEDMVFPP